jgi:hypothetical protein
LSNNKIQSKGSNFVKNIHNTEMKQENNYGYKKISSSILQGNSVINHVNYDEETNSMIGSNKKIAGVALNKWMSY